jgi:hypothetical protein
MEFNAPKQKLGGLKMVNTNEKLYLGTNGHYYKEHEIAMAFFLATGREIYDEDKPGDGIKMFDAWVYDLMGLSIKNVVNKNDVSYEDCLKAKQEILAVQLYRERNNSTLREAKDFIDELKEKLKGDK